MIGVEVKAKTTNKPCMFMSRYRNLGRNRNIKVGNRFFENVIKIKYFETKVTNQFTFR
jgi:hypothetical protein